MPDHGFSGPTLDAGRSTSHIAQAWTELMKRLGHQRCGAQGGDWGAFVAREIARIDAGHVVGVHVNVATFGLIPLGPVVPAELDFFSKVEKARLARLNNFLTDMNGYFQIEATRPQTLAYALTDSPVGQLAWVVEKFEEWTHPASRLTGRGGGSRSHVDECNVVLPQPNRGIVRQHLLRKRARHVVRPAPTGVAASAEEVAHTALRRAAQQHRALVGLLNARSFRRNGGTGASGKRRAQGLPRAPLRVIPRPPHVDAPDLSTRGGGPEEL